jgi:hypothetical protein
MNGIVASPLQIPVSNLLAIYSQDQQYKLVMMAPNDSGTSSFTSTTQIEKRTTIAVSDRTLPLIYTIDKTLDPREDEIIPSNDNLFGVGYWKYNDSGILAIYQQNASPHSTHYMLHAFAETDTKWTENDVYTIAYKLYGYQRDTITLC